MSCECIQLNSFGQCDENLIFNIGTPDLDLIFCITGRSNRIYQISVVTDSEGLAVIPTELLPGGYLSIYSKDKYKVWFTDDQGNKIELNDSEKNCFEFEVISGTIIDSSGNYSPTLKIVNPNIFIDFAGKGDGDTITHDKGLLQIVTFYNSNDDNRQMNDFYATNVTETSFVLKNDFSTDKYSGKLLCVKY